MNKQKQELRKIFLEAFILSIIKNIPVSAVPKKPPEIQSPKPKQIEQFPPVPIQQHEQMQPSILKRVPSAAAHPIIQVKPPYSPIPRPAIKFPPRRLRRPFLPRAQPSMQTAPQNLQNPSLSKVSQLLYDPRVRSIECPGPEKPILVSKSNVIQHTTITLTKEEINNVIKEISEKTRIPVISGVFKAAFDNFIITAVISGFIGTRFIIEKKVPEIPQHESFKRIQF